MKHYFILKNTLVTLSLAGIIVVGCKTSTDTPNPVTGLKSGLIPNLLKDIEEVAEAEFDDSLFYDGPSSGGRRGGSTLPASFALDGPPIISQGNTGKCGVFSSAYYIIGLYNGVNGSAQNYDKVGSTDFAYSQYKKITGDACGGEGGVIMYAQGTRLGMADILQQYGTTSWNQLPFRETNDCTPLTDDLVTKAVTNKIGAYRRIDKTDYRNPTELKAFLYGGFPLWIGVNVEENWQKIGTSVWTASTGKTEGHAMVVVGWDDSKKAFKIANSWGPDWGDKGYGWVDYTYFAKLLDELGGMITVLYPSESQIPVFSNLSPGSCGKAGWGDIVVTNNRSEPVAIEITGDNKYVNRKTDPTEANELQTYSGIPQGAVTIKVFNETKTTLLNTFQAKVTKCAPTMVTVN